MPTNQNPKPSFRLTKRRIVWLLLAAISVFVLGPYLVSRTTASANRVRVTNSATAPERECAGTIKIITYNIAHGRGATDSNYEEGGPEKFKRVNAIAEFLKQRDADIVVLNEVDFNSSWSGGQNQAAAIAQLAEFPYLAEQRNLDFRIAHLHWSFGNAVLSKFPIADASQVNLPAEKAWEDWLVGCKRGVVGTIEPTGYANFRVMAVHLEHRHEPIRVAGSKTIIELAKQDSTPLIAAGDFNSTPAGFPRSHQSGPNALDLLRQSEQFQILPANPPPPIGLTFSTNNPQSVIDWILVPPKWKVISYTTLECNLSDHRPVETIVAF